MARMAAPTVVPVNIPGTRYDIIVQCGLLASAGQMIARLTRSRAAAVVTDSIVGPLHLTALTQALTDAGISTVVATVPAGEKHKNIEHIAPIYDQLLSSRIERSTPLIAFGGGVVGDMGGFVAATILRGVPFIQFPTSLLAMVDASVGGKTGIDHPCGKNLIGAFHQPSCVLIDPQLLATLPPRELRSGLAECIKHEIIRDAAGFASLEQSIERALAMDVEYLTGLVAHNVSIKSRIVAADPLEQNERAHLNFGHTIGHAIELASGFGRAHGEAVALGMVAAARLAEMLEMLDGSSVGRIVTLIGRAQLPIGGLNLDVDAVLHAMRTDKKVRAGRVRFVLPVQIGQVVVRDDVPPELVRRAVESLR